MTFIDSQGDYTNQPLTPYPASEETAVILWNYLG